VCQGYQRRSRRLRSSSRKVSVIAALSIGLDRPRDATLPGSQVHIPVEILLESAPEPALGLQVVAIESHVHIGARAEAPRLDERAEKVDGLDRGEARGQPQDGGSDRLQYLGPQGLPLAEALLPPPLVVLAGGEG
jgi:hypothetical protein